MCTLRDSRRCPLAVVRSLVAVAVRSEGLRGRCREAAAPHPCKRSSCFDFEPHHHYNINTRLDIQPATSRLIVLRDMHQLLDWIVGRCILHNVFQSICDAAYLTELDGENALASAARMWFDTVN